MDINRVTVIGYSMVIDANGGEEELIIQTSGGQSGHVAMQAIATSVDGGSAFGRKTYWSIPYGTHNDMQMRSAIADLVQKWGAGKVQAQEVARLWYDQTQNPRTEYAEELSLDSANTFPL